VQHLPEFSQVRLHESVWARGGIEKVTFRRLLSHRSGLISEGPFSYWDSMQFPSMEEIIAALPQTEVVLAPDAGAKYSNLAFALMGEVVERLSGQPFHAYVRQSIFAPLGMTSSSFLPEPRLLSRMATGYRPHPFEDVPEPSGHTPTNGIAAAAGLYTTVTDLARWLSLQLTAATPAVGLTSSPVDDEAPPDPKAVLSPRSLDEMHTPQAMDADWTQARCLGWFGQRRGENVSLGHGGSMHGFITQVLFHKSSRTGVIVLTNEGRHAVASLMALDLLDTVLAAQKEHPEPAGDALPAQTPAALRRFLGRYQLWAGAVSHVEYRQGALTLQPAPPDKVALHAPAKLAPTDDPLVYRVTQARAAGELLRFTAEGEKITGFTISGFRYDKLG
jgi:CubicO group peptidase (beta-lactamase class C family)